MTMIKTLAAVAAGIVLATSAFAQSAREVRGPSPLVAMENEPAPRLIVDPPLPGPLARGAILIPYHVENFRILTGARDGRPQRISTGRASARNRRRPALALGRLQ